MAEAGGAMQLGNLVDIARARAAQKKIPQKLDAHDPRIDKVAEEFEAVFLSEMLKHVFKDMDADPNFGGGSTEEIWKGFMIEEYGKVMARTGGVGIAPQIKEELIKLQDVREAQQ